MAAPLRDWCPGADGIVHEAILWGLGFLGEEHGNFSFPLDVEPEKSHWLGFPWRQGGVTTSI